MTQEQIERTLRIEGCVLPAATRPVGGRVLYPGIDSVLGQERTAYFYRKMAILFLQAARKRYLEGMFPGYVETNVSLAKSYLKSYRKLKGVAA